MWCMATDYQDGILTGAQAQLFTWGLRWLLDDLRKSGDKFVAVERLFGSMTFGQKIAAVHTVANCVLREDAPAAKCAAVLDATVGEIYAYVAGSINVELERVRLMGVDAKYIQSDRQMVIAAMKQLAKGERGWLRSIPDVSCNDFETWKSTVDILMRQVLDLDDYILVDLFADLPPAQARKPKQVLGYETDYFTTICEDLNEKQIRAAVADIRRLIRGVLRQPQA